MIRVKMPQEFLLMLHLNDEPLNDKDSIIIFHALQRKLAKLDFTKQIVVSSASNKPVAQFRLMPKGVEDANFISHYKSLENFEKRSDVCYISESGESFTWADLLVVAEGHEDWAKNIFDFCGGQSPYTVWDEFEWEGKLDGLDRWVCTDPDRLQFRRPGGKNKHTFIFKQLENDGWVHGIIDIREHDWDVVTNFGYYFDGEEAYYYEKHGYILPNEILAECIFESKFLV